MDPLSIALGAGSVVSGIFGSGLSYRAQKAANEMNWKINQINNDFNERMMNQQLDYNTDMWIRQNEYNTPLAQRQRLAQAGLNPYLMLNGSNTGTATSAPSVSMPSAGGNIPMQAPKLDLSSTASVLGQLASMAQQSGLLKAQEQNVIANTTGTQINNDFLPKLLDQSWKKAFAETQWTRYKSTNEAFITRLNDATFKEQTRAYSLQNMLTNQQISYVNAQETLTRLSASAQQVLNKYLDSDQQISLLLKVQTWTNMKKQGLLTDAQVKETVAREIKTYADARLADANTNLANANVDKVNAETANIKTQTAGAQLNNKILRETASSVITSVNAMNFFNTDFYNALDGSRSAYYKDLREYGEANAAGGGALAPLFNLAGQITDQDFSSNNYNPRNIKY